MLEKFADCILFFTHTEFIAPLIIICFIFFDKKIWGNSLIITLFSGALSSTLKIFFHIPSLPPLIVTGYSFPSGHMQVSSALYIWIALNIKNRYVRGMILILLPLIAWGLVYKKYHTIYDILGGLAFGACTSYLFYLLHKKNYIKLPTFGLMALPIIFYMLYKTSNQMLLYRNLSIITGFYGVWWLNQKWVSEINSLTAKAWTLIIYAVFLAIITYVFPYIYSAFSIPQKYHESFSWFFTSASLILSVSLPNYIIYKTSKHNQHIWK